jgi:hypothetical protein
MRWSDIELHILRGHQLRAEAVGNWIGSGWKTLVRLVRPRTNGGASEGGAAEDRAARRLRLQEFVSDPSKGFFWPRLSWIAHEGLRLVPKDKRQEGHAVKQDSRLSAGQGGSKPTGHRAIGG